MFAYETQILQRLALLVACHDLAVGQIIPHYLLFQRPMSWFKAREFCRRHYVDLTVLSTEEQYFTLLNATAASKVSFWLGLQRQSPFGSWQWVDGEELTYDHWYRKNYKVPCASLEAMLKKDKKLLARYCDETHMFVCQGPVSPQQVRVDSVGSNHVILSWNISAFMQMTAHSYNVTMCSDTCDTFFYPYTDGSTFMNINISNLTSATVYFIKVSAFVVRPDSIIGGNTTLQSGTTASHIRTVDSAGQHKVIIVFLKWLKLVTLAPTLWLIYRIQKKKSPSSCEVSGLDNDTSPVELLAEDAFIDPIPVRIRGIG